VDALLVCHTPAVQHRAIDLVRRAVEDGRISRERLAQARARITELLAYAGPPPDRRQVHAALRTPEHLAVAARIPPLEVGRDPTAAA
jgi:beta-N-acetylhexosaminidase